LDDCEEGHRTPKRYTNSRYENNVPVSQSEFLLIYALSSYSPLYSYDNWLVDNGTSKHLFGYKVVLSNMVERETSLKIILQDNSTYLVKGFGSIKFSSDSRDFFFFMK